MKAANPCSYDHTLGGGCYSEVVNDNMDGYYMACGDRVSVFLAVSTATTWKSTSSVIYLTLGANSGLSVKSITNNCNSPNSDSTSVCSNSGSASATIPAQTGSDLSIQLSKMSANSFVVFRIDFIVKCDTLSSDVLKALWLSSYKIGSAGGSCDVGVWIDFTNTNDVLHCDDHNACTTEVATGSCSSRWCQYTSKSCDDGNACTTDSCMALLENVLM